MSDTERLEAAAAKLEAEADWADEDAQTFERYGFPNGLRQREAKARTLAALLRAHAYEIDVDADTWPAALAVADAVLGVPASPKEQAP